MLVEEGCQIARELYLGIVVNRAAAGPVLMVSSQGGMDIEKVAHETPELIFREAFDPDRGLQSFQVRKLCEKLAFKGATVRAAESFMKKLCRVFVDKDCSLVEINPLVVTATSDSDRLGCQRSRSIKRREFPSCRTDAAARHCRRRTGRSPHCQSRGFLTSSSTATSAAWSMALAWP